MPVLAEPRKRLFTVDDYYRMAETGILRPDDRVELIEGEIIQMTPMGSRHASCLIKLNHLLTENRIKNNVLISLQTPLRLDEITEAEPDVLVLTYRSDFYRNSHPSPDDILLLIEVAESSLSFDRNVKFPLYARHGVQEAWLVDLEEEAVEVHRAPSEQGYQDVRVVRGSDTLAPMAFPECSLTVNEILGKES